MSAEYITAKQAYEMATEPLQKDIDLAFEKIKQAAEERKLLVILDFVAFMSNKAGPSRDWDHCANALRLRGFEVAYRRATQDGQRYHTIVYWGRANA